MPKQTTRRTLENFHGAPNAQAVAKAWPYLGSEDYHLRYAAHIAIEWQDPKSWAQKAYKEKNDLAAIHALLGLARSDLEESLKPSINRLLRLTSIISIKPENSPSSGPTQSS